MRDNDNMASRFRVLIEGIDADEKLVRIEKMFY